MGASVRGSTPRRNFSAPHRGGTPKKEQPGDVAMEGVAGSTPTVAAAQGAGAGTN